MKTSLLAVGPIAAALLLAACGGSGGPVANSGSGYEEYTCPDPIGKIVREDCSRVGLRYDGESFEGSVGVGGVGASASYKQTAIRQADALIELLKEQRVAMCNNFNTCKLTVAEYQGKRILKFFPLNMGCVSSCECRPFRSGPTSRA